MSRSFGAVLREVSQRLAAAGVDAPGRDARALLAKATGVAPDRVTLMAHDLFPHESEVTLEALVVARESRKPMAQVIGKRSFFDHDFVVTPDVLDPRPETERLVELALGVPFNRVLDLGTGSGAILLSLLAARDRAQGVGTDVSAPALAVAQENARRLDVEAQATFVVSDWFSKVEGLFDLIVSNPPYIAEAEMATLASELSFEPRLALTDGGDGLGAYRAIAAGSAARLRSGGRLMVEIGWQQRDAVCRLFETEGFVAVTCQQDLDGRDRVISAIRP